jgi:hypothetical protein
MLLGNSNAGDATINVTAGKSKDSCQANNTETTAELTFKFTAATGTHVLSLTATQLCELEYSKSEHSPMSVGSNHDLWIASSMILWVSAVGYAVYMGRLVLRDFRDITGFNEDCVDSFGLSRKRTKVTLKGFSFLRKDVWRVSVPKGFTVVKGKGVEWQYMTMYAKDFLPFHSVAPSTTADCNPSRTVPSECQGKEIDESKDWVLVYDYIFIEALVVCFIVSTLSICSHLLL